MKLKNTNNLLYRADDRTIGQFKKDLSRDTEYERIAANLLKSHLEHEGKNVEIQDYGMDNSGKLIVDAKKVSAKADYIFIINGKKYYFEIKVHSDKYPCMTFKKSNIETYAKNDVKCVIITESCFYIFGKKLMEYMIEKCQAKSYLGFAAGKLAYRLSLPEISVLEGQGLIKKCSWNKNIQEEIKNNSIIFERRKK
jgi:hypothetical protein